MFGLKKNDKKGYIYLLQNKKVVYEYYYTDKAARNIKIKQWQERIRHIERRSVYHIVIRPTITERDIEIASRSLRSKEI